jgi:hypothetical protein
MAVQESRCSRGSSDGVLDKRKILGSGRAFRGNLKFWFQTGLLADFVGRGSIELFVSFDHLQLANVWFWEDN